MNFFKRAFKYCIRQRTKNMILFCIMSVIAIFLILSVSILTSSKNASLNVKGDVTGKLQLTIDETGNYGSGTGSQNGMSYIYNGDKITPKLIEAISKVEGVVDYNSETKECYYGAAVNFKYLSASFGGGFTPYGDASGITCVLSSKKSEKFESGVYKLKAGRHIQPDDQYVALMSDVLAEYNNLKVGDKIKLYLPSPADSIVELEIVGIYEGAEGAQSETMFLDDIDANVLYSDFNPGNDEYDEPDEYLDLTIYVEDPVNIRNVYNRIMDLPEMQGKTLKLEMDNSEYEQIVNPLTQVQKVIKILIIVGIIVSIIVLTLILNIWIRNRKQEIAILIALGNSKKNIFGQFLCEVLGVAMFAFVAVGVLVTVLRGVLNDIIVRLIGDETISFSLQISSVQMLFMCIAGSVILVIAVSIVTYSIMRHKLVELFSKTD